MKVLIINRSNTIVSLYIFEISLKWLLYLFGVITFFGIRFFVMHSLSNIILFLIALLEFWFYSTVATFFTVVIFWAFVLGLLFLGPFLSLTTFFLLVLCILLVLILFFSMRHCHFPSPFFIFNIPLVGLWFIFIFMWNFWMLFSLSWAFFVIIFVMVSVLQMNRITFSMRVQDVIILASSTCSIIVELCTILGQNYAFIGLSQKVTIFTLDAKFLTSIWPN